MNGIPDGFGGGLTPGRQPALVCVDLIRAYFTKGSALCLPSDAVLDTAARVLAAARAAGVMVVHTRVAYAADGTDGGHFVVKVPALRALFGGGPMSEVMPQMAPVGAELVVVKQYASAFFGTSLASTLQAAGVDTVVVVGVSTSGCVRATAVDALQLGFVPVVVEDAVADRADEPHRANLADLATKYAEIRSAQWAVDYLGSRS